MMVTMVTTVLNHDKVWLGLFSGDITKPRTHFRHTGDKHDHFDDGGDGDDDVGLPGDHDDGGDNGDHDDDGGDGGDDVVLPAAE